MCFTLLEQLKYQNVSFGRVASIFYQSLLVLISSMPPALPCLDSIFPSLPFALLICLPSPHVPPSMFPTYLLPPLFTSRPLTSSSSLQHLCPCGGGVPERRKPPGQSATSQMVSKLHLHYLSSPLLFLSFYMASASQ